MQAFLAADSLVFNLVYYWDFRYEDERKVSGQGRRGKRTGDIAGCYVEDIFSRERRPVALQPSAVDNLRNRPG